MAGHIWPLGLEFDTCGIDGQRAMVCQRAYYSCVDGVKRLTIYWIFYLQDLNVLILTIWILDPTAFFKSYIL